jgi:RNA polymerase sigma-70 factor (ECF subfamily)
MDDVVALTGDAQAERADADEALAAAARTDPDAFGTLYARHRLRVYRYLRSRTPIEDDALELTAVTFERALASIGRYRPRGGGFVAWLLRIARNAALDHVRRVPTTPLPDNLLDGRTHESPEGHVLAVETRAAVARAMAGLPEAQREALALRYGAGLTAGQIGTVIGKSDVATQRLLQRALTTLRERIRDDA